MAPLSYQPSDWYWFIGGDTTNPTSPTGFDFCDFRGV